jgi:multiple antibiotic resistance protein
MGIINSFLVSFFALFVAIDAVGILPIFIAITDGLKTREKRKVLKRSLYTAIMVAIGFMFLGGLVFWIMGITMADFQIAGGIVLLVFSIYFLMDRAGAKRTVSAEAAVFPLGTPLIVGPAVLTTLLLLKDARGVMITCIAFAANMGVVWMIFERSAVITRILGKNGIRAVSKVVDILLSAFAVMLIRKGLQAVFL